MTTPIPELEPFPSIGPLGVLQMRIPASTAARMLTTEATNPVTERQVRKARSALATGERRPALDAILGGMPLINAEVAWKLHYEWMDRDYRRGLERAVWRALADYRDLLEREQLQIVATKRAFYAAELSRIAGHTTDSDVDKRRDAFNLAKASVDAALERYEEVYAIAKSAGVHLDRHKSIQAYRDMLQEGKPVPPKHKKGGGDVHSHHKPTHQQLMEAAGR